MCETSALSLSLFSLLRNIKIRLSGSSIYNSNDVTTVYQHTSYVFGIYSVYKRRRLCIHHVLFTYFMHGRYVTHRRKLVFCLHLDAGHSTELL